MTKLTCDVAIIGAGTAGLAAERSARRNGAKTLLIDEGFGGTTCASVGCMPSKLLIAAGNAMHAVEQASVFGIDASGKVAAPGIYVRLDGAEAKIGSLGLKVRNGCTYHGVAVNIDMDLSPFDDIDPCGFPGLAVTDVKAFGVARTVDEAGTELAPLLAHRLVRSWRA